jgi:hypothetical protein
MLKLMMRSMFVFLLVCAGGVVLARVWGQAQPPYAYTYDAILQISNEAPYTHLYVDDPHSGIRVYQHTWLGSITNITPSNDGRVALAVEAYGYTDVHVCDGTRCTLLMQDASSFTYFAWGVDGRLAFNANWSKPDPQNPGFIIRQATDVFVWHADGTLLNITNTPNLNERRPRLDASGVLIFEAEDGQYQWDGQTVRPVEGG